MKKASLTLSCSRCGAVKRVTERCVFERLRFDVNQGWTKEIIAECPHCGMKYLVKVVEKNKLI